MREQEIGEPRTKRAEHLDFEHLLGGTNMTWWTKWSDGEGKQNESGAMFCGGAEWGGLIRISLSVIGNWKVFEKSASSTQKGIVMDWSKLPYQQFETVNVKKQLEDGHQRIG